MPPPAATSATPIRDSPKMNKTDVQREDEQRMPFQGTQPYGMAPDLVIPGIMDIAGSDERLWVPQAPNVAFRPLLFGTSQGYFVNILRVKKAGILSRHKHTGPVHAFTLKGKWHYLEHDCESSESDPCPHYLTHHCNEGTGPKIDSGGAGWATEGGYSMEPPGETHTLEVPDGVDEMITIFHVTGAYVYVDPHGGAERIEDVFTKLELARAHYERVGLGADFVNQFIR